MDHSGKKTVDQYASTRSSHGDPAVFKADQQAFPTNATSNDSSHAIAPPALLQTRAEGISASHFPNFSLHAYARYYHPCCFARTSDGRGTGGVVVDESAAVVASGVAVKQNETQFVLPSRIQPPDLSSPQIYVSDATISSVVRSSRPDRRPGRVLSDTVQNRDANIWYICPCCSEYCLKRRRKTKRKGKESTALLPESKMLLRTFRLPWHVWKPMSIHEA